MSSRIVSAAGGRNLCDVGEPRGVEALRLAVRDARRRCSDRTRAISPPSSQRSRSRLPLVAVRDVQQLHDVRPVLALALAARARSPRRSACRSRETTPAAPCGRRCFRRSRSSSACVCLPLWSSPSNAIRVPRITSRPSRFQREHVVDRLPPPDDAPARRRRRALRPAADGDCSSTPSPTP